MKRNINQMKLNTKSPSVISVEKLLQIVTMLIIVLYLSPAASFFIGPHVLLFCILLFLFFSAISCTSADFFKSFVLFASVIGFVVILYYTRWSSDVVGPLSRIFSIFLFFFPIFIAKHYFAKKQYERLKNIIIFLLMVMGITAITSIVGSSIYPDASRSLATGRSDLYALDLYNSMNIGGYGNIYSFVLMLPLLVHMMRTNKDKRIFSGVILVLLVASILKAQYAISVLLSLLALVIALLFRAGSKFNKYQVLLFLFMAFLGVVLFQKEFIIDFFRVLAEFIDSPIIASKLNEVNAIIDAGIMGQEISIRFELYMQSVRAFTDNVLVGTWGDDTAIYQPGGHSEILDLFGAAGFVGFLSLCFVLFQYNRYVLAEIPANKSLEYVKWSWIICFVLGLVNTLITSSQIGLVVFFVVPSVAVISPSNADVVEKPVRHV